MNVYIIGAEDLEPPAKKAKTESVTGITILTTGTHFTFDTCASSDCV